jgi:hypothetical protein
MKLLDMKLAAPDGPDGGARVLPPRCNPTPSMGLKKRLAPHGGPPKFYVPNCSAFDPKTTPHFTADGNTAMARIIGSYYTTDQ